MIETYLSLFLDTFLASLVLPVKSEMVLPAMLIFNAYDKYLVLAVALAGSVIALLINWQIGKFFSFIKRMDMFADKEEEIIKIENFWNKYVIWFLPVATFFGAIGPILCLFSGFFRVRFWYLLPLIICGRAIYYLTF